MVLLELARLYIVLLIKLGVTFVPTSSTYNQFKLSMEQIYNLVVQPP